MRRLQFEKTQICRRTFCLITTTTTVEIVDDERRVIREDVTIESLPAQPERKSA